MRAGDWASSVPDLLVAHGRLGVLLDESPALAKAAFEKDVADAGKAHPWLREHPVEVTWPGGQFASGRIDPDDPLVHEVAGSIRATQRRHVALTAPYGSDPAPLRGHGQHPDPSTTGQGTCASPTAPASASRRRARLSRVRVTPGR